MSIKAKLLKRLEEAEKKILPGEIAAFVIIKPTDEKGVYSVSEAVYFGEGGHKEDYTGTWTVKAENLQEAADSYKPPEGCKEPLKFIINYD
jgi:hypothetical protein